MVGISPLKNSIDVLPGWHKVGYFPNDYSKDSNKLTSKEKILNDILVMGRLDVFVEEGKEETIVLNYQTLDEEVVDYNCLLYTSPSPRDQCLSRMPSSA